MNGKGPFLGKRGERDEDISQPWDQERVCAVSAAGILCAGDSQCGSKGKVAAVGSGLLAWPPVCCFPPSQFSNPTLASTAASWVLSWVSPELGGSFPLHLASGAVTAAARRGKEDGDLGAGWESVHAVCA
jgi:hypothetical protein